MKATARFDPVIHANNRLQLCAMLAPVDTVEFATLREALDVSESVLSKHLKVLEEAGYVALTKATLDSRVRTWVALTREGRRALQGHIAELRRVVELAQSGKAGT